MNNAENIQHGFELLTTDENEKIIFGVLKYFHINPLNPNYDDLVQEGRLAFVDAYCRFVDKPSQNYDNFQAYAYQRVKWQLNDLLNRQTKQNSHADFSLNNELIYHEVIDEILIDHKDTNNHVNQVLTNDFFNQLFTICNQQERRYLTGTFLKGLNGAEIADYYNVSRQAVNKWKQQVTQKAKLLSQLD
jgi:RNA polymerase sigma factor (sigma-70 family)